MYHLSGGVILGWALGSNDGANVFGTAVASRMVRYRTAVILAAVFIILGALLQGATGIRRIGGLAQLKEVVADPCRAAMFVSAVAGLTVLLMTALKLPVSASQAVVGAILGMGLALAPHKVQWTELGKIVICWVGTPVGAAAIGAVLYPTLGWVIDHATMNFVTRSIVLKALLLGSGCYAAYALGANNVANSTGVFAGTGLLDDYDKPGLILSLVGGASIALGVLTYSRNVMFTVGRRLVQLGAFSALVAVLAQAITVHVYAVIGVPVSTSQAVVGAVLGIGLAKSVKTINRRMFLQIIIGWVATPVIAGVACYVVGWAAF